jgi:hypothetical protein
MNETLMPASFQPSEPTVKSATKKTEHNYSVEFNALPWNQSGFYEYTQVVPGVERKVPFQNQR